MDLICPKCLSTRTGDKLGDPCQNPGCDGVIARQPEWRELVDELSEPMTCGRRNEHDMVSGPFLGVGTGLDRWQRFKTNGQRVCSYCGSLHPDDFFEMVRASAEAPEDAEFHSVVEIEQSDKNYKIYVHATGIRNAHEGGIKFYTHHLPRDEAGKVDIPEIKQTEFKEAKRRSNERFKRFFNAI